MIPSFDANGNLPPGIHRADWLEVESRFGFTAKRTVLLAGLRQALEELAAANCGAVYIDGSFVTNMSEPADFDACWDVNGVDPGALDMIFFTFDNHRSAQKARFGGELFPAQLPAGEGGRTFLEFFQIDRYTGQPKGIVLLDPRMLR